MPIQTEFVGMKKDRGFMFERTQQDGGDLEKAFAEHWEDENEVRPWLNQGHGLLQNLFFKGSRCCHVVNAAERYVAATVIQWLGTNCGFSFLQEVLRKCGYYITEIPQPKPLVLPEKPNPFKRKFG